MLRVCALALALRACLTSTFRHPLLYCILALHNITFVVEVAREKIIKMGNVTCMKIFLKKGLISLV